MNACEQWFGEILSGLDTKSPAHERADGFVVVFWSAAIGWRRGRVGGAGRWDEQLGGHSQLPGPGEEARCQKWSPPRRNTENRRFGQLVQSPAPLDVGESRRLGGDEAIAEAELLTELDAVWFLHQKSVRPRVDDEPIKAPRE